MELIVGRVVKPHGIAGEIAIEIRTDDPEERFAPGARLSAKTRDGRRSTYTVEQMRPHGGRALLRLTEVTDRGGAEALRGHLFVIDTDDLPPITEPDTYYDHELEGLTVVTTSGVTVGTVAEVVHTAAGELLAVRQPDGMEALVPFVSAIVTSVSPDDGVVRIDPPEGLLDIGY